MLDLPVHPIIVHFPIAIGCLLPLLMLLNIVAMRRWQWPQKTWWMIVAFQLIFLLSSIAAVEAGEWDEENRSAPMAAGMADHEEWGEKVPIAAGVMLVLTLVPLFIRKRNHSMMIACIVGSAVVVVLLIKVGHTGGLLVYDQM
jgi:uncharacterized membrane protein